MNILEKKRAKYSNVYKRIFIVGCPNVGKSTIFRKLCKKDFIIYNYPNTSIEIGVSWITIENKVFEVIDTPGCNSIYSNSEDDKIVREFLLEEDEKIILQVTDSRNIRRTFLFTIELSEFGVPLILDFNMADEIMTRGISVDYKKINDILGIRTVQTIANEGEGIEQLKKEILKSTIPKVDIEYSEIVQKTADNIRSIFSAETEFGQIHSLLYLTAPESIEKKFKNKISEKSIRQAKTILNDLNNRLNFSIDVELTKSRIDKSARIESQTVHYSEPVKTKLIEKIEKLTRIPVTGIPIFLFILFLLYLFVGLFGAGILANFIQHNIFENYIVKYSDLLFKHIDFSLLRDAFTGQYGIISFALTLSLGVVFPIITTFFFASTFIEDSGYLPRLSILFDRTLKKIGISGRAIMPIVLGFSCITMALLSTRIIETKKERLITAVILIFGIPCSAQSSILLAVIATISLKALIIIFVLVSIQILIAGYFLNKFIPGNISPFIMELPPLRKPEIRNVLYKTWFRIFLFMREVFPLFILACFCMFVLDKIKLLGLIEKIGTPVVKSLWGLPTEATGALLIGFARKEAGAAVIKSLADGNLLNEMQIITIVIITLLFIPCFSSFIVLIKEYGLKNSLIMLFSILTYTIIFGGFLNHSLKLLY